MTPAATTTFAFRLYVAGSSPRSAAAVRNLRRICDEHLHDDFTVEVVDLGAEPQQALEDNIIALPTLVCLSPSPARQVIGDLSDTDRVLDAIGVSR